MRRIRFTPDVTRRWLALTAGLALFVGAALARAEPSAEQRRLIKLRDAERYEIKTPHSRIKAGAARIHVAAPLDVVRKSVLEFDKYDDRIKKFSKATVVGRKAAKTDVYVQVPILKGLAKVWAVVRFSEVKKTADGQEVLVGRMIKGNVKRLDVTWRLTKIDEVNTQLNLEMLIVPEIPAPGSVITGEVAYAADEAVLGLRNHSEGTKKRR